MSKIKEIIEQIENTARQKEMLEREYTPVLKRKGEIYYKRNSLIVSKVKSLMGKLKNIANGSMNHFEISYIDNKGIFYKHQICVPGDIKEEDVIDYYEYVHGVIVETVAHIQTIKMGFTFPSSK